MAAEDWIVHGHFWIRNIDKFHSKWVAFDMVISWWVWLIVKNGTEAKTPNIDDAINVQICIRSPHGWVHNKPKAKQTRYIDIKTVCCIKYDQKEVFLIEKRKYARKKNMKRTKQTHDHSYRVFKSAICAFKQTKMCHC